MVCKAQSTSRNHSTTAEMKQSLHIQPLILQSPQPSTLTRVIRGTKTKQNTEIDSQGALRYRILRGQSIEHNGRQTLSLNTQNYVEKSQINEENQQFISQTEQG